MSPRPAVCVMAKAPVAGAVKTRLCPPLLPEAAAALAAAFLEDTWRAATRLEGCRALLSWAGELDRVPPSLGRAEVVPQIGADLGARIESALTAALARGNPALVIGSDLPALPPGHLEAARAALQAGADVALGPSGDGGFYLIGARRWEDGLLADLPWSAPETREAAAARLGGRGYQLAEVPSFDDIDDAEDLERLRRALVREPDRAPATAKVLRRWGWLE